MIRHLVIFFLAAWLCGLSGCVSNDAPQPFDCDDSDLSLMVMTVIPASSCSVPDGSIVVSASGGEQPYTFTINDMSSQTGGEFLGLNAGIYSVKASDGHQCSARISNVTVLAAGFSLSAEVVPDNLCLEGGGSITVQVSDGQPPFQYRLEDGPYVTSNLFTGLQEGDHRIGIKDVNDCEVQLNITVPHGFTEVSWMNEILPLVEEKCSINNCHDGKFRPDLRKYEKASFYAGMMKDLTMKRIMPFEGSLTQDQIDLIGCWVDDGALQN
jgi:SprB repeat